MKKMRVILNKIFKQRHTAFRKDPDVVNNKLYVLVSNKLNPIYAAVQGGHAIAQFLIEHPNSKWQNNTVVYLSCNVQDMLQKITKYNFLHNVSYFDCKELSIFREPDLDNELTAIAAYEIPQKYVKHLKLLK